MSFLDWLHGGYVHTRRVRVLRDRLAALLSQGASVLDVGAAGLADRVFGRSLHFVARLEPRSAA